MNKPPKARIATSTHSTQSPLLSTVTDGVDDGVEAAVGVADT